MESESAVSKLAKRTIKNQIIIRGSGFVGAGMQKVGVGLIAESVRRQRTPMQHKTDMFDYNSKGFYRRATMKRKGTFGRVVVSTTDWEPNPRVEYARRGFLSPPEHVQEKRSQRRRERAEVRRVQAPRRIGFVTIALGRGLPILASGYIAHSILTSEASVNDEVQRAIFGGTIEENIQMAEDIKEQTVLGSPYAMIALRTGFTVGFGAVTGLFS